MLAAERSILEMLEITLIGHRSIGAEAAHQPRPC